MSINSVLYMTVMKRAGLERRGEGDREAGNGEREHPPTLVHAHKTLTAHTPSNAYSHTHTLSHERCVCHHEQQGGDYGSDGCSYGNGR